MNVDLGWHGDACWSLAVLSVLAWQYSGWHGLQKRIQNTVLLGWWGRLCVVPLSPRQYALHLTVSHYVFGLNALLPGPPSYVCCLPLGSFLYCTVCSECMA
jgi:hypothetical protein